MNLTFAHHYLAMLIWGAIAILVERFPNDDFGKLWIPVSFGVVHFGCALLLAKARKEGA